MYEKILVAISTAFIALGTIWYVCRRDINRRTGKGDGSDTGSVGDNIEAARRGNCDLEDAERATAERLREQAESIERAGSNNKDAQQLVQKAKRILHSAKHTD